MTQILRDQHDISPKVPLPVERVDDTSVSNDVAAEVLTWFYVTSGAYASATGQAAGTVITGKLAYSGVLNSMKTAIGSDLDSSFSLGATTRLDTRIDIPSDVIEDIQHMSPTAQVSAISTYLTTNGHYYVDHRRSQIWGKSKAIVADDAATYSYSTTLSGGGTGDKVDLIKVGGSAVGLSGQGAVGAGTQRVTEGSTTPQAVGSDATGADTYATVVTPSAAATHIKITNEGVFPAIISLNAGATDHIFISGQSEVVLDAVTITNAVAIQAKNGTAGSNYTGLYITIW